MQCDRLRASLRVAALIAIACFATALVPFRGRGSAGALGTGTPQVDTVAFAGQGKLAFVQHGALYALDGDADTLILLDAGDAAYPVWSPDGLWVAYVRPDPALAAIGTRQGELWLVHADGTDRHVLTGLPAAVSGLAWSPTSDILAVTLAGAAREAGGLWLVTPNGAAQKVVPDLSG